MLVLPLVLVDTVTTARTKIKKDGHATTTRTDGKGPGADLDHASPFQQKVLLSFSGVVQGIDAEKRLLSFHLCDPNNVARVLSHPCPCWSAFSSIGGRSQRPVGVTASSPMKVSLGL